MRPHDPALFVPVLQFVCIFMLMALSVIGLRARGVLSADQAPVVSRIVTDVVLPALILSKVSSVELNLAQASSAIELLLAEAVAGLAAWLIGKHVLKLDRPSLGAFILASTFGSTSLMGSALVQVVFPDDAATLAHAILIAQAGVGLPLSTIGLLIAMSFGTHRDQMRPDAVLRELAGNPIILAFLLGIAWNLLEWPHQGPVLTILFGALDFAGNSLTFLTAALVGLTLKPITRADLGWPLGICAALLLIVEPVVAYQSHFAIGESPELSYLLLLLASMPSASISIAFSLRYGCNAELASKLVAGTTLISIVTLPLFAWLAG